MSGCNNRLTLKHYHYYNPASQTWNWEYDDLGFPNKASVMIKCDNVDDKCDQLYKTIEATITSKLVEEPNCCEHGAIRYIANATFEGTTYTQSKDFAIDKTSHSFDYFHAEKDGHSRECIYCGLLEGELLPHEYGLEGESFYTCNVCGYVDKERKDEYKYGQIIKDINDLIARVLLIEEIKPYHEGLIRDVESKYDDVPIELKDRILNYDKFLAFKNDYQTKFAIIFGDTSKMYGHNLKSKADQTEVVVNRNESSSYGYGFGVNVVTESKDNALKFEVSTPTYSPDDEYEGVFYTHNIPMDLTLRFVSSGNDVMIAGSENIDLGNGWVERKINRTRMQNLTKYKYDFIYITLGANDNEILSTGEYFVSNLYAIKPEIPTSGKHYFAKTNSFENAGNVEFWQYDGRDKIYLSNPDSSFNWEDASVAELGPSHPAYLAPYGSTDVDTTDPSLWEERVYDQEKRVDGKKFNQLQVGVNPQGEEGPYVGFSNYVFTDWEEKYVGVNGTYSLPNSNDMKFVNTISLTYFSWEPAVPIDIRIKVLDQSGNYKVAFEDTISHSNSPITKAYRFEECNFYQLLIETKAFSNGASGWSRLFIKDLSLSYTVPGKSIGCYYPSKPASESHSGNKQYWVLYEDPSIVYLSNPDPIKDWDEGDSPVLEDDNPAFLGKYGTESINLISDDNWETSSSDSTIRMEYDVSAFGKTGCASFRNYQYFDWKEEKLGLTAIYTNPNEVIQANSISFAYYIERHNADKGLADLNVEIYVIDKLGYEKNIDSFVIGKAEAGWKTYSKTFVSTNFYQLKIVTKSEFVSLPDNSGINTVLHVNNLKTEYITNLPDYIFDTTDSSLWKGSSQESTNKIVVGTKPFWEAKQGTGQYLALRNYQYTDWKENQVGVSATYTLEEAKMMNSLAFKYNLSTQADSFDADKMTVTIEVYDNNNVSYKIDSFTIVKEGAVTGVDIPYTKDFGTNINVSQLVITLTSFVNDKSFKGSTCIFIKDVVGSFRLK